MICKGGMVSRCCKKEYGVNDFIGRTIKIGSFNNGDYQCQYQWPDDCFVQCGGDGIVFTGRSMKEAFDNPVETVAETLGIKELEEETGYRTAFFEAFPRNPDTFIRGEGKTIEAAETAAWEKYRRYAGCDHPEWEKRGYTNGLGFCVKCGMSSSKKFAPWDKCKHCDYPIYPNDYPNGVCFHCHMLVETGGYDDDGILSRYRRERRAAARALVEANGWLCPDCNTPINEMRLVSSLDYRLTREERQRQSDLYCAVLDKTALDRPLFSGPNVNITFPASVFYECKCEHLKLIADLVPGEQQ